jgi:hypothetical protein
MIDLQNLGHVGIPTRKDVLRKRIENGEIILPIMPQDRHNYSATLNKLSHVQLECVKLGLFEVPETP